MSSVYTLKALGLNTQPNQLEAQEGSLTIAKNIVINRDNTVESRRGFKIYGNSFGSSGDRAKQLMNYKERILRHYASTIQFDNGSGLFSSFAGTFMETDPGLRIKSIESNGNLYLTTANGIMKIAAKTAADFSTAEGYITNAGAVKAVDVSAKANYNYGDQSSFLVQDSAVAYRVVWGYRDVNNNLFLGAPSQRVEVYNPLLTLLLQDYMVALGALDKIGASGSMINDQNYVDTLKLSIEATAPELRSNLIALATKLDNDIFYAGTTIPATFASFTGQVPGMTTNVTITADVAGVAGNVALNFDGVININNAILAWNGANPGNTLTLTSGDGTQIPNNAEIIQLAGGAAPVVSGAPLVISSATIVGTICTITFSSGTVTDYFASGSEIYLDGFNPAVGSLNGGQTVAAVTATEISFNTTASGAVTIDADATIVSNAYRIIEQPPVLEIPTTHGEMVNLQTYFNLILTQLNQEFPAVIPTPAAVAYIQPLDITTASTVTLNITIPQDINSNYFFQIYRSAVFAADDAAVLSTDVSPNDELQLVYEAYPTPAELAAGYIIVEDIVPDAFRGANLYTNASTGEGILQANDVPPFAKDINVFKNSVFYANTRTRQRKELTLLGVQNLIDSYNNGVTPTLTIASNGLFHTYSFVLGTSESIDITTVAGASLASSGTASYFFINSGQNEKKYYFWYNIGTATDPAIAGRVGIEILADALDTDVEIAEKTRNAFNIINDDFAASSTGNVISVLTSEVGYTDDPSPETSGFTMNVVVQGSGERVSQEKYDVICTADTAGSLAGKYFSMNSTFDQNMYYVWFKVNGVGVDPAVTNKTGILVNLVLNDSATLVADKIQDVLEADYSDEFTVTSNSGTLSIVNKQFGPATNAAAETSGFTIDMTEEGLLNVLISEDISPARAVTLTSNSLSRVINQNGSETIYDFYTSGAQEVPGKMVLEGRSLNNAQFYLSTNNTITGDSFNPSLAPTVQITSISVGGPNAMLVTTAAPHGLTNLDYVILSGTNSHPSIDGYRQITYVSPMTFRVNETIAIAGNTGGVINAISAESSSNEEAKNRVYYSKTQQPESVPILNYMDVGAKDKAILRIFPLRDSLFVFKEDGLYRISGESIPFNLALFDGSCIIVAADSVSSVDNVIYVWTRQGISSVTESGVRNVSRPLDIDVLPLASSNYPNFKTATWGLGYESDKSYTVFTVSKTIDTYATKGYKYNSLTNSWTSIAKDYLCGVVNSADDKMYVGVGDTNNIEQERKSFSREDYADREYQFAIQDGRYLNKVIALDSVANIDISDVFMQYQTVTVYDFNVLLKKIDLDPGIPSSNYFSTLNIGPGDNAKAALLDLADKLDNDNLQFTNYYSTIEDQSGSITNIAAGSPVVITSANHGLITGRKVLLSGTNSSPTINNSYYVTVLDANTFSINESVVNPGSSGTFSTLSADFTDLQVCYNAIIQKLNLDGVVAFSNYTENNKITKQEILITNVDRVAKRLTVAAELDFLVGDFTVFKSIDCEMQYSPNTFGGDPVSLKHMREAQMLFETLAFTRATISFATDLLPKFESVPFEADGNGRFGFNEFGLGFFGGASNSSPIRTYIPRNCQRCRYMVIKFNHRVAREKWSLFGISITGETELSTRAYK